MARSKTKTDALIEERKASGDMQSEGGTAVIESFANEARHQHLKNLQERAESLGTSDYDWTTELADYVSEEALDILRSKLLHPSNHVPAALVGVDADYTVELWRFENPSGFIYVNLYATHDGAHDYNRFYREASPIYDIQQHTEMRALMKDELDWTPWDSLDPQVQRFITLYVLPDDWGKFLLAGGEHRDFVLDRVMVFKKAA